MSEAFRKKYWSEMDETERLEALRRELARTQEALNRSMRNVATLLRHQHGEHGLLVPYGDSYEEEKCIESAFRVGDFVRDSPHATD